MPRRHRDWLRQARRKLESAKWDIKGGFHEDACFSSQQAAEAAAKALLESRGRIELGHSIQTLLRTANVSDEVLLSAARRLDSYYIPTRYPNGFASGVPMDYYDEVIAQEAVDLANAIVAFAEEQIGGL